MKWDKCDTWMQQWDYRNNRKLICRFVMKFENTTLWRNLHKAKLEWNNERMLGLESVLDMVREPTHSTDRIPTEILKKSMWTLKKQRRSRDGAYLCKAVLDVNGVIFPHDRAPYRRCLHALNRPLVVVHRRDYRTPTVPFSLRETNSFANGFRWFCFGKLRC